MMHNYNKGNLKKSVVGDMRKTYYCDYSLDLAWPAAPVILFTHSLILAASVKKTYLYSGGDGYSDAL